MITRMLSLPIIVLGLSGCVESEPKVEGRWYTQSQVDLGKTVFSDNCARCHGAKAQGTDKWRTPLPDGNYPPPPLNGSAHAWHHPLKGLQTTLREGGARFGGTMPGFGNTLSEDEQDAAIAYFQSLWTQDIYQMWLQRGGLR
jgi:mono/diheme cytochrome c family protein